MKGLGKFALYSASLLVFCAGSASATPSEADSTNHKLVSLIQDYVQTHQEKGNRKAGNLDAATFLVQILENIFESFDKERSSNSKQFRRYTESLELIDKIYENSGNEYFIGDAHQAALLDLGIELQVYWETRYADIVGMSVEQSQIETEERSIKIALVGALMIRMKSLSIMKRPSISRYNSLFRWLLPIGLTGTVYGGPEAVQWISEGNYLPDVLHDRIFEYIPPAPAHILRFGVSSDEVVVREIGLLDVFQTAATIGAWVLPIGQTISGLSSGLSKIRGSLRGIQTAQRVKKGAQLLKWGGRAVKGVLGTTSFSGISALALVAVLAVEETAWAYAEYRPFSKLAEGVEKSRDQLSRAIHSKDQGAILAASLTLSENSQELARFMTREIQLASLEFGSRLDELTIGRLNRFPDFKREKKEIDKEFTHDELLRDIEIAQLVSHYEYRLENDDDYLDEIEKHRSRYLRKLRELQKEHPLPPGFVRFKILNYMIANDPYSILGLASVAPEAQRYHAEFETDLAEYCRKRMQLDPDFSCEGEARRSFLIRLTQREHKFAAENFTSLEVDPGFFNYWLIGPGFTANDVLFGAASLMEASKTPYASLFINDLVNIMEAQAVFFESEFSRLTGVRQGVEFASSRSSFSANVSTNVSSAESDTPDAEPEKTNSEGRETDRGSRPHQSLPESNSLHEQHALLPMIREYFEMISHNEQLRLAIARYEEEESIDSPVQHALNTVDKDRKIATQAELERARNTVSVYLSSLHPKDLNYFLAVTLRDWYLNVRSDRAKVEQIYHDLESVKGPEIDRRQSRSVIGTYLENGFYFAVGGTLLTVPSRMATRAFWLSRMKMSRYKRALRVAVRRRPTLGQAWRSGKKVFLITSLTVSSWQVFGYLFSDRVVSPFEIIDQTERSIFEAYSESNEIILEILRDPYSDPTEIVDWYSENEEFLNLHFSELQEEIGWVRGEILKENDEPGAAILPKRRLQDIVEVCEAQLKEISFLIAEAKELEGQE